SHAGKSPSMRGPSACGVVRTGATTSPTARIPLLNARTEKVFSWVSAAGSEYACCATAIKQSVRTLQTEYLLRDCNLKITVCARKLVQADIIGARVAALNVINKSCKQGVMCRCTHARPARILQPGTTKHPRTRGGMHHVATQRIRPPRFLSPRRGWCSVCWYRF